MSGPVVVRGDARRLPLPDASVDLVVTSPPYFALRSYTDGGEHYAGQIGSEPTPAAYIAALVDCTREWVRVLKPSGSIFADLGDKYSTSLHSYNYRDPGTYTRKTPQPDGEWSKTGWHGKPNLQNSAQSPNAPPKSLMLLPERYRIACVDQLGLIARAVIVWAKPNGLPESVTDRVRRSHEDWVHLTKAPQYFAAVDEIREPHSGPWKSPGAGNPAAATGPQFRNGSSQWDRSREERDATVRNPLGKLPGSVWEVATEPLQVPADVAVDHFAAFPSEWPRRLILGWSPPGICTACGEGRRLVVTGSGDGHDGNDRRAVGNGYRLNGSAFYAARAERPRTITGYACACTPYTDHPGTGHRDYTSDGNGRAKFPFLGGQGEKIGPWREYHFDRWTPPPTRPSVVLDPFGGTGTVAHVAAALGRIGISVDLSGDYCRLAAHPELADRRRRKVLGLDRPVLPVVPDGQLGFDWDGASA